MSFQAVVLAAGKGTRMRSHTIKVLHKVMGKTLIDCAVDSALLAGAESVCVVLGHDREQVLAHLQQRPDADRITVATQLEQLGTGHAVHEAREQLAGGPAHTLVLCGDVPNLTPQTLSAFVHDALSSPGPLAVMTATLDDPASYGRMVRSPSGDLTGIVEFRDADDAQRTIHEINTGIIFVETAFLLRELQSLCDAPSTNAQREFYLTDLVQIAAAQGTALGWKLADTDQMHGVNTRADLSRATHIARQRINAHWMEQGVTMLDAASTFVEASVVLEQDVELGPGVSLRGQTHIATGCVIDPYCVIEDAHVGAHTHILAHCVIQQARLEAGCSIGPFAHLRPGSDVGEGCKVGNFVELKKTRMDAGSKASHLSYIGDAHVGAGANIGAGTITCNYDGANKSKTTIGAGAFIGSNSALVAPVIIDDGAYVAAGSTITNTVPKGALGVARTRQQNIEGWVARKVKKS